MPWGEFAAVGAGAAAGAWLRWCLNMMLNPLFALVPLGTLTANLVGGLLMGLALEWFTRATSLPPETRLLITTGFLGGLTTFSTFSGEVTLLLMRREWLWGALAIAAHVVGSITLTVLGIFIARAFFTWGK